MTIAAGPTRQADPPAETTPKAGHLDAIDVVRVLTVALVIAVHTISFQPRGTGLSNGAVLTVAHVSREVFFLLTAFVLGYSYRDRAPRSWPSFWRRRYLLVGVPYLVWSAIYFVAGPIPLTPAVEALRTFAGQVVAGTAAIHLYFLLVSMQLYLVFPLLRWLVRASRGRHGWLLVGAAAFQVAFYAVVQAQVTAGPLTWWLQHPDGLLPSYLGFVLIGAVAADHVSGLFAWTRDRARWVYAGCAVAVAAGIAVFFVRTLGYGTDAPYASAVFQPVVVVESVAVAWVFLALGLAWERRGTPGRRPVRAVSDASFGVYLAHPLLLQGVLMFCGATGLWALGERSSRPLITVISLVVVVPAVYLVCAVFAEAVRRTPLSLPLTGRQRAGPRKATPIPVSVPPGEERCAPHPA